MTDEPKNGADGNDSAAAAGGNDANLARQIEEAVQAQTAGLKKNNTDLKNEKTALKEQLDKIQGTLDKLGGLETIQSLGDADRIRQMVEMQERFKADEQGKLLTEGKYDEWFDRRTAALRRDHENQMKVAQTERDAALEESQKWAISYRKMVMENEVSKAATALGVEPSAIMDIQLRAERSFQFDAERQRFVLRDEDGGVVFGKDGNNPKSVSEWLEEQRDTSRHWWPPSKSGGAGGSDGPIRDADLAKLSMRDYEAKRMQQGFKAF